MTLTATPIRTLYMSPGIRDISVIDTPPAKAARSDLRFWNTATGW